MKLLIEPETGVAIASMVTDPKDNSKNIINNSSKNTNITSLYQSL
jgi:hypothetical protein